MSAVLHGITWEAKGYDLVDRAAQPVHPHVGAAVGQVGLELPAEPVLGRGDKVGFVAVVLEGPDRIPGDGHMAALDKRDVRGHDHDSFS